MSGRVDHLDAAYESLRAWCHERPDLDDASTTYAAFGSITRLLGQLAHIVDLAVESASRATCCDDGRSVLGASAEIRSLATPAAAMLNDATAAVSRVHSIVGHLIFVVDAEAASGCRTLRITRELRMGD